MSFMKSTPTLKNEVLEICSELTDGTSDFDSLVVEKLNNVYQGLIAGGNEFGIDVNEPWLWAQAKRPIVFSLLPAQTGNATLTNGSTAGVFSSAPTTSMEGRFLKITSRSDYYRITSHVAGNTSFSIDQLYLDDSGLLEYSAFKLDYDLIDDNIVIDSTNNKIDFRDNGTIYLATVTSGSYTPTTLCAEVKTRLDAAGTQVHTVTFDSVTRKFTISSAGSAFSLLFLTGSNITKSTSSVLGFDLEDKTGALSYESSYSLNGIVRFSKPIQMFRDTSYYTQSAKDTGKIFILDDNTFLRDYPMSRLITGVPDKFCLIDQGTSGLWKIRMNATVLDSPVRAEANVIPVPRKLVDSDYSFPLIQGSGTDYLVFGAAYFVLLKKNDDDSEKYYKLAASKLLALISQNRKGLSVGGNRFGKLVPRLGQIDRNWRRF